MNFIPEIVLGLVQGTTEFLPISSTGHLHLVSRLFGITPSLNQDIFLNTATLLSVLVYFSKKVPYFFKNILYIIIGTIPTLIVGIFFKSQVEAIFSSSLTLPYEFLFTSALLISTRFISRRNEALTPSKGLIIGLFQSLAIIPAISRSGATIFAGLLLGLSPLNAFSFSFTLFIPASFGAIALDYQNLFSPALLSLPNITSFILAFLSGLVALKLLSNSLQSRHFYLFGFYTLFVGLILFFL